MVMFLNVISHLPPFLQNEWGNLDVYSLVKTLSVLSFGKQIVKTLFPDSNIPTGYVFMVDSQHYHHLGSSWPAPLCLSVFHSVMNDPFIRLAVLLTNREALSSLSIPCFNLSLIAFPHYLGVLPLLPCNIIKTKRYVVLWKNLSISFGHRLQIVLGLPFAVWGL